MGDKLTKSSQFSSGSFKMPILSEAEESGLLNHMLPILPVILFPSVVSRGASLLKK